MLEAVTTDLVSTISLKRSTQNLQLSTSWPADYPIYWHNVWSGRASQVDFAELAVSGLASMYPASDWSVLFSGPSWISARVRSH